MTMYYSGDTWSSGAKPRKVSQGRGWGSGGRDFQRTNGSPLVFQTKGLVATKG